MKKDYDIEGAFAAIEDELISSMMRNMKRHRVEEVAEDKQWEMWQALQLKSLEEYKKKNQRKFTSWFSDINGQIDEVIKQANQTGQMEQELEILKAIKKGFKGARKASSTMQAEFFRLNERKLDALIKATTNDLRKAEYAILRRADDQYRKAIFNAQVYANSGAGTYEKAVDMATKDMLSAGLNCVEYANGARHTLKDYADMAIRTASKRAYLQGEGMMRQNWGISTVIINKRGNPCPKCLPFVGKVLIDDVWSGGKASDGPYPLMSSAIEAGLYHPRCKDSHTTYFEGISTPPDDKYTKGEIQQIEEDYREEQKEQYAKRQAERFGRLAKHSLDEGNQKKYDLRKKQWQDSLVESDKTGLQELVSDDKNAITDFTESRKQYNEKVQKLSEFEKQADDMLDAYMDAMDTPKAAELEQAFNEKFEEVESFKQVVKDMKATLSGKEAKAVRQIEKNLAVKSGIPIDSIKMTGLEYDTADMVYGSYKTVLNKYPELRGQLVAFKYDGVKGDAYAGCMAMTGEVKAHGIFAKYSSLVKTYADDVADGFHPVGTDHNSIIVHELGHALDGYMTKKGLLGGIVSPYGIIRSSVDVQKQVLEQLGWNFEHVKSLRESLKAQGFTHSQIADKISKERKAFITRQVSEYAADNEKEFFAECFAEYVMSDKPRKAAQIFGKIIDDALGR